MPATIDTILTSVANPGANFTATTPASGDTVTVRNFAAPATAKLEAVIRGGATAGAARVRSPLLHDDVQGLHWYTSENPSVHLLPPMLGQPLRSGDQLTVEATGGTAETDLVVLRNYYSDLPGSSPRLYMWGDISGLIEQVETIHVAVTASATIGVWSDTDITSTENLIKANTDYAVLGYVTDTALTMVGIRGTETNNFRICGPGVTTAEDTSYYFVDESDRMGTPHIPVFNANNRGSTFVSVANDAASTAANVTLICAQLAHTLG